MRNNRKIIGYPDKRTRSLGRECYPDSLRTAARYWDVAYYKLYYRVAIKGMTLDHALEDLGVNIER